MKKFFAALSICMLFVTAASFCEMGPGREDNPRHEGMMGQNPNIGDRERGSDEMMGLLMPLKELKLSEDQKKAIEKITLEHKKFRVQKEADIKLARIDLAEILRKSDDFQAERAKVREISNMQMELKMNVIDVREKILNSLTKEQKDKLAQLKTERRAKWMEKQREKKSKKNEREGGRP